MFYGPAKCFNKLGKLGKRLAFSSPTMVLLEPKKILNANFKPRFSFNGQFCTIFDEFDINVSPEEAFIIFNLKDLGKFRTKDKKLLNDLKGFWGTHKEYALEDSDFNETLRELKNVGLIDFRRGAITLPENLVIKLK